MRHRIGHLACSSIAVFAVIHGIAAGAEEPRRSALDGVPGLEKPVTSAETKIPLGELVRKIAADTGVALTAAPEVADEPVALAVTDLPARDLLQELADLLDYQWHLQAFRRSGVQAFRTGRDSRGMVHVVPERLNARTPERRPVLEIYQDLAARSREAALREQRLREVQARFREELHRSAAMAALPADAFQRLLTAAADRLRQAQALFPVVSDLGTPEGREQRQRDEAVHSLQSPVQRTLALLVDQLPAEQWERLLTTGRLIFSTQPGPGEVPFPAEIEQRLRASGPTYRTAGWWMEPPTAEDEDGYREDDRQMQAAWTAAGGYRATVELDPSAFQWHAGLILEAHVTPLPRSVPLDPSTLVSPIGLSGSPGTMFFLSASPYEPQNPDEALTPELRARLAKDPVFGAIAQPCPDRRSHPPGAGLPPVEKCFQDYLPELARRYHVSFLADAYWGSPRLDSDALPAEPTPLYALLERLVSGTYRWDRRGRLVRVRSRNWFVERPCEVPLRLVRQWNDLAAGHGALTLDAFAACAATLSDGQIDSLDSLIEIAGLSKDFAMVPAGRQGLRLYATLTPAQRQALWQHQTVVLVRLTSAQRALLVATLREGYRDPAFTVRPEWLARVRLSLKEEPLTRVRRQRGSTVTEQDFPAGTPELAPSARSARAALPAAGSEAGVVISRYPIARVSLSIDYEVGWSGPPPLIVSLP